MKKISKKIHLTATVCTILFFFFSVNVMGEGVFGQQFEAEGTSIVYELPYPGLLPDHPLYPVKDLRDKVMLLFTIDKQKKAELLHLLSDKKAHMGQLLMQKGRWKLAISSLGESSDNFTSSLVIYTSFKHLNSTQIKSVKSQLTASCRVHMHIVSEIVVIVPQENIEAITEILNRYGKICERATLL